MGELIFVVDDNDVNLAVAASALDADYTVLTMSSAQKMFELLGKKRPALIFLDIEMPQMGGFEAMARLKEKPEWKDIPVVFVTGWIDEKINADFRQSGALDIIQKPIKPPLFLEYAKKYLSRD